MLRERVLEEIKRRGLTSLQISKVTGFSKSAVDAWRMQNRKSKRAREMPQTAVEALAKVLGVY